MLSGFLYIIAAAIGSYCLSFHTGTWFIILFDTYMIWGIWYAYRKLNDPQ